MAYPVIGQAITLEIADGYFSGRYQARVQDMETNSLFIDIPLKHGSKYPTNLPTGQQVLVQYRTTDGALCTFQSAVQGRDVRQISLLQLHKPESSQIRRFQRREFLRVPILATFHLVFVDSESKEVLTADANGCDISGGGLSLRVRQELPVRRDDIIGFRFQLPLEGRTHEIVGKARVIRVAPVDSNGWKLVSLKYFEIQERERQRIVQYSFHRQIELREKGLLKR
ncbi:c-di-GMP-binding flagellar brake protein YcgR [Tumebacillus sp. BK434]|uniref:flagellar brake protein n=1 Tax=Tumebacillus sp. BK434 TaxID=2512169 RepID=UPI0010DC045B|nr:flagellar brake domain-containing protein [Tumebacillus sp. BK434]TCP59401.1 c-di-GMP-binding flagellar brake protein YcgR [Tumebacillus sp. BK434]